MCMFLRWLWKTRIGGRNSGRIRGMQREEFFLNVDLWNLADWSVDDCDMWWMIVWMNVWINWFDRLMMCEDVWLSGNVLKCLVCEHDDCVKFGMKTRKKERGNEWW